MVLPRDEETVGRQNERKVPLGCKQTKLGSQKERKEGNSPPRMK